MVKCTNCGRAFSVNDSDWASLCQDCGEDEESEASVFGRNEQQ